jgi:hypothetical protein
MATEELIVTKQRKGMVLEFVMSQSEMEMQYKQDPQAAYTKFVHAREPSDAHEALLLTGPRSAHPVLRELLDREKDVPSFTLLVLSGIKEPHRQSLKCPSGMAITLSDMPFLKQVNIFPDLC